MEPENLSGNNMFEEQLWLEMKTDLEIYRNFNEDFLEFVAAHEKEKENG